MRPVVHWLAAWLLVGCAASVGYETDERCEEMAMRRLNVDKMIETRRAGGVTVIDDGDDRPPRGQQENPNAWGNAAAFPVGTFDLVNTEKAVVNRDQKIPFPKNPQVKNIMLAVDMPANMAGSFAPRWKLQTGIGGAQDFFIFDAVGLQQLTLSAELLRASVIVTSVGAHSGVAYVPPTRAFRASAFFCEGTTATDSPTFTERFSVGAAGAIVVPVPKGASTWRILGDLPGPFVVTMLFATTAPDGNLLDSYFGDYLEDIRIAPIPVGLATNMSITNAGGAPVIGSIEWGLDF